MYRHDEKSGQGLDRRFKGTLMLIGFGMAVLAFLVSIDHPEWFHVRPLTNSAIAMAAASDRGIANTAETP